MKLILTDRKYGSTPAPAPRTIDVDWADGDLDHAYVWYRVTGEKVLKCAYKPGLDSWKIEGRPEPKPPAPQGGTLTVRYVEGFDSRGDTATYEGVTRAFACDSPFGDDTAAIRAEFQGGGGAVIDVTNVIAYALRFPKE